MKEHDAFIGHSGITRCNVCKKIIRTVWSTAEWHKANDPFEGYCDCVDNAVREMVDVARKHQAKLDRERTKMTNPEIQLTVDELNIARQWFDAVQDLNPAYLTLQDYELAQKIYQKLGMRVPLTISVKTSGETIMANTGASCEDEGCPHYGTPHSHPSTLFDYFTGWLYHQQYKHDLGEDFVEKEINKMSNFEFLKALSDAMEEMNDKP